MKSHEVAKEAFLPPAWCAKAAEDLKGWTGQAVCWLAHDGSLSCDYHETYAHSSIAGNSKGSLCQNSDERSAGRACTYLHCSDLPQQTAPHIVSWDLCFAKGILPDHPAMGSWYPPPIYSGSTVECSGGKGLIKLTIWLFWLESTKIWVFYTGPMSDWDISGLLLGKFAAMPFFGDIWRFSGIHFHPHNSRSTVSQAVTSSHWVQHHDLPKEPSSMSSISRGNPTI